MLHLHAIASVPSLDLKPADALLVSTSNPGKLALVRFLDGDFRLLADAIETGQLANAGQPLACEEVEQWVALALGDPPPTPMAQSA